VIRRQPCEVAHDAQALDWPAALEQQHGPIELWHVIIDH
jgi:hypothetical protein